MEKNEHNPLVSVIVPSYNHAPYIHQCILSIVNQTYKNIELIVIDDGSTDNSQEILENLQKQYGFILEFQSNRGVSATLNKAINNYAHGKYIACIGSDDMWVSDKIEKEVLYMESDPECALVFGKVHTINKQGDIINDLNIIDPVIDPVKCVRFESLIERNCIPAVTAMYRKEVWEACGKYNEQTIVNDWDLWLRIAHSRKLVYLNEYFSFYRWHGANMTCNTLKMYTAAWQIVQSWKDKISPELSAKVLARRNSLTFAVLARSYKKEALRYLKCYHSYWDTDIILNYMKGVFKLVFIWQ